MTPSGAVTPPPLKYGIGLVARVGRTTLAMARNRDLPDSLKAMHPVHKVPNHAKIALAIVMSILVVVIDLRGAICLSSFGVLLYYFMANFAAVTLELEMSHR